eukprot:scpid86932/ scgid7695/ 
MEPVDVAEVGVRVFIFITDMFQEKKVNIMEIPRTNLECNFLRSAQVAEVGSVCFVRTDLYYGLLQSECRAASTCIHWKSRTRAAQGCVLQKRRAMSQLPHPMMSLTWRGALAGF